MQFPASAPVASPTTTRIIRRALLGQLLFSLGNALTVGAFFNYFIYEFGPSATLFAVSQILPESAQALSLLARPVLLRGMGRKRLWLTTLLGGRTAALLIPAALLFPARDSSTALLLILVCTAVWYFLQGMAYVSLISWLSDLVPDVQWGRLFRSREIAGLAGGSLLLVAYARRPVVDALAPAARGASYAVLFIVGGLIAMCSALPLLWLPDIPVRLQSHLVGVSGRVSRWTQSFRWLAASRWWAAFFQGLTQSVIFLYSVRVLQLELETSLLLSGIGRLLQLPAAWWGGKLADAGRDRAGLALGLLLASFMLPCWLLATPERWWWLFGAHACWSGFGLVNVCGPSLCLKHSPRSDNATHWAMYEQVAGLIAGGAGLLGGIWLDQLLSGTPGLASDVSQPVGNWLTAWLPKNNPETTAASLPYQVLLAISWAGRATSPLWLLGVRRSES